MTRSIFTRSSLVWALVLCVGLLTTAFMQMDDHIKPLEIGKKAPMIDKKVRTVSGDQVSLEMMAENNGLLVMFTCNTCPYVKAWEDRYPEIYKLATRNNIGMIALNPNEGTREEGDGLDDMKERAEKKNYKFVYALDLNHQMADAYGATRTPEIFLFNDDMKLVYHGAIDDNYENAEKVEKPYLKNAIKSLAGNNKIQTTNTKSIGCSIKRGE